MFGQGRSKLYNSVFVWCIWWSTSCNKYKLKTQKCFQSIVNNILRRELQFLQLLSCLFIREIPRDKNLFWLSLGVKLMQLTLMTFFTCRREVSTKIWEFCPEQNLGHIIPHGVGLQQQALPGISRPSAYPRHRPRPRSGRRGQAGRDSHAGRFR
jgi:hypothetical protein